MAERIYVVMYDEAQEDGTVKTKADLAFRDYREAIRRTAQMRGAWLGETLFVDEVVDYNVEREGVC